MLRNNSDLQCELIKNHCAETTTKSSVLTLTQKSGKVSCVTNAQVLEKAGYYYLHNYSWTVDS